MRTLALASSIAPCLLAASLARADAVVGPLPSSCPPGSTPSTIHSGPYCEPAPACTADSACGAPAICAATRQCIEIRACGGHPDSGRPCTVSHVVGPCAGDGSCAVGACSDRRVCSSGGGGTSGGCGCRVATPGPGPSVLLLIGLGAAVLALVRRRR